MLRKFLKWFSISVLVFTMICAESNLTGITLFKAGARTGLTSGTVSAVDNYIYVNGIEIHNAIISEDLVNDGHDSRRRIPGL